MISFSPRTFVGIAFTFILILTIVPEAVNATIAEITPPIADSEFDLKYKDDNNGLLWKLGIYYGAGRRIIVKFDLSSVPFGSTINEAKLLLRASWISWGTGANLNVYRVTHNWAEGDNTNGVTWNEANHIASNHPDGCMDWADGGEWTTIGYASSTIDGVGWIEWTVTDIVKAWIEDGEVNYGFIIISTESLYCEFYSKDSTNLDSRPILIIDYISHNPVGGIFTPVNRISILAPFIVLVSLIGVISTIFAIRRWRKD